MVTVDLAEAEPVYREQMRRRLGEPFRTLLGSLRHEVAHYYWSVLVLDAGRVESFRAVFGDERVDYSAAVQHYYASPPAWDDSHFVSRYAQAHPHEDWAETFALYLHIVDLVDTAAAYGLIDLPASLDDRLPSPAGTSIDDLVAHWVALAAAIDGLADSVGAEWLRPSADARLRARQARLRARPNHPSTTRRMNRGRQVPTSASEQEVRQVTEGEARRQEGEGDTQTHHQVALAPNTCRRRPAVAAESAHR